MKLKQASQRRLFPSTDTRNTYIYTYTHTIYINIQYTYTHTNIHRSERVRANEQNSPSWHDLCKLSLKFFPLFVWIGVLLLLDPFCLSNHQFFLFHREILVLDGLRSDLRRATDRGRCHRRIHFTRTDIVVGLYLRQRLEGEKRKWRLIGTNWRHGSKTIVFFLGDIYNIRLLHAHQIQFFFVTASKSWAERNKMKQRPIFFSLPSSCLGSVYEGTVSHPFFYCSLYTPTTTLDSRCSRSPYELFGIPCPCRLTFPGREKKVLCTSNLLHLYVIMQCCRYLSWLIFWRAAPTPYTFSTKTPPLALIPITLPPSPPNIMTTIWYDTDWDPNHHGKLHSCTFFKH